MATQTNYTAKAIKARANFKKAIGVNATLSDSGQEAVMGVFKLVKNTYQERVEAANIWLKYMVNQGTLSYAKAVKAYHTFKALQGDV